MGDNEPFVVVCIGCGKKIMAATIFQLEATAKLGYREGEVAGGNIGPIYIGESRLESFFVERRHGGDAENTTREIGNAVP